MEKVNTTQKFLFLFLHLNTVLWDSTSENFANIWQIKWNWRSSIEFKTVQMRIHFLKEFSVLLFVVSCKNFASMGTWRNDLSSLFWEEQYRHWAAIWKRSITKFFPKTFPWCNSTQNRPSLHRNLKMAIPHSRNFNGNGYKLSARQIQGSFGWTSVIYDRLMAALNTIDQSWLTHVHPNDPRNHCAQNLYPFSLEFTKWGIGKTFLKEGIWRIKIYFVDGQANFITTITTERINTRLVSHNWITRDKRPWQRLVSKERIFRSYLVWPCLRSALK